MSIKFDYSRFLIVDLEGTCWKDMPREEQSKITEIIQFGIVEVDLKAKVITKEKLYFVKPTVNKILSPYCTELTGITQLEVDQAELLMKVSKAIRRDFNPLKVAWGAWGDDNLLVTRDCQLKNAVEPFSERYYDLQEWYAIRKGASQRTKVASAMEDYNLTFEGKAHNALVDARNTARLFLKML